MFLSQDSRLVNSSNAAPTDSADAGSATACPPAGVRLPLRV